MDKKKEQDKSISIDYILIIMESIINGDNNGASNLKMESSTILYFVNSSP